MLRCGSRARQAAWHAVMLAIKSRYAMKHKGQFTIEASSASRDDEYVTDTLDMALTGPSCD